MKYLLIACVFLVGCSETRAETVTADPIITVGLSTSQWNQIFQVLGDQPLKVVFPIVPIIQNMQFQAQAQTKPKDAPKEKK